MKIIKLLAILFFDLIDKYLHQKKILKFLKVNNVKIEIFFDVGSHKGTYTDLIKDNFNFKKIFMFEPQKNIFKKVKLKYKKLKKINIYNCAISNVNSTKNIFINKHDLTSSLSKIDKDNNYLRFKAKLFSSNSINMIIESYKIKTLSLKKFISNKKIKRINLLKIDTEGHELQVLEGLDKSIKKVQYILIEFHRDKIYLNYQPKKIHSYLIKNDFVLKDIIKFPFTTWEDRFYLNKNYK